MKLFKQVIAALEDGTVPFSYYAFTFLSAVSLRIFLEFMVTKVPRIEWHTPLHFTLFYVSLGLTITLVLRIMTGEEVQKIARSVSAGFLIVATVPIMDLLFQLVWKYPINYLYIVPERHEDIVRNFLLFFGNHAGATPGMRVEIFSAMLFCGMYVFSKTSSAVKAALTGLLLYAIIYWCYGAICYFIEWSEVSFLLPLDTSPRAMIDTYLFFSLHALLVLAYVHRPQWARAILRDIRPTRLVHYLLMLSFGFLIGYKSGGNGIQGLPDFFEFYFMAWALVFAIVFSTVTNNVADICIDRISNPGRPTVTGVIPQGEYMKYGVAALLLALAYSLAAGYIILFLVACFICNYFLYSMPPLRLKRVPILSKGFIALNSLAMLMAGFGFTGKNVLGFPPKIAIFVIASFTVCANFIDLKDYKGDGAAGIKTIPVIMGLKNGKLIIGIFFVLCYASFPFIAGMPGLFAPSAISGLLLLFFTNKKAYREAQVFGIYLSGAFLLFVYLLARGRPI